MSYDPDDESLEGGHYGRVQVTVVKRVLLRGLVFNVGAHHLHSIPTVSVVCGGTEEKKQSVKYPVRKKKTGR